MSATSLRSDSARAAGHGRARRTPKRSGESPPIRLESVAERCLDDGASCGMRLHKFAVRSVDHVAALTRALESGNAAELAQRAHTVKALAADLDALALHARADELERTAANGDMEQAGLALVRTREEIDRCVEAAGRLLAQWSSEPSSDVSA